MSATSNCIEDFIAATFAYEFMDGVVDLEVLERIHRGDVSDWVLAVADSGLFSNAQVDRIDAAWQCEPKLLLDALLAEADEVTVKRCEMAWSTLNRVEATGELREPVAVGGYSTAVAAASTTIA